MVSWSGVGCPGVFKTSRVIESVFEYKGSLKLKEFGFIENLALDASVVTL